MVNAKYGPGESIELMPVPDQVDRLRALFDWARNAYESETAPNVEIATRLAEGLNAEMPKVGRFFEHLLSQRNVNLVTWIGVVLSGIGLIITMSQPQTISIDDVERLIDLYEQRQSDTSTTPPQQWPIPEVELQPGGEENP